MTADRGGVLSAKVLLLWMALLPFSPALFASTGTTQSQDSVASGSTRSEPLGVQNPRVVTKYGEVTALPSMARSGECHRQNVIMQYEDSRNKPFIKFTGTKKWCYNRQRVTFGTMEVQTWIRPDSKYGPGQDGYRYVASGLKKSDRFLTYKGRRYGAHESIRVGRFEYRAHGFPRAAQVLNPYVSRTGRYDGACDGPRPKDASPKVSAVRPARGAKGVSPSADVEASFSKEMRAGTIGKNTFQVIKKGAFDPVRATIRYNAVGRKAVLNPSRRLSPGTYSATVYSGPFGALTSKGDPLKDTKAWSFTVGR